MKLWLIHWMDAEGQGLLTLHADTAEEAVETHAQMIEPQEKLRWTRWEVREIPEGEFVRFTAQRQFRVKQQ